MFREREALIAADTARSGPDGDPEYVSGFERHHFAAGEDQAAGFHRLAAEIRPELLQGFLVDALGVFTHGFWRLLGASRWLCARIGKGKTPGAPP